MSASSPLGAQEQESPAATQWEWRVQRIGWVVLGLIVVLALSGVFGVGPLSWSVVTADDASLEVSYQRFTRNGAPSTLSLRVPASAAVDGEVLVRIDSAYLEALEVTSITPEPASQTSERGGVVFAFETEPGASLEATLNATGDAIGVRTGRLAVVGHPPVEFRQIFYP